jgi:hypothetical protein
MGAKNIQERFRVCVAQKANSARKIERSAVQSQRSALWSPSLTLQEWGLPAPEERRHILERAGLVLARAQALSEALDAAENGSSS